MTPDAGTVAHADKLKEMQALLLSEMRRLDDPWRFSNQPGDDLQTPPGPGAKGGGKKKNAKKAAGAAQ